MFCRSSSIFERTPFAAIVSMGLNKLMRRRVSGSVATRVTMRATLVQLREDEDETTSVRAITLHCKLKIGRGDPTGLLYGRARARCVALSHGRGCMAGAVRLRHMRIKHVDWLGPGHMRIKHSPQCNPDLAAMIWVGLVQRSSTLSLTLLSHSFISLLYIHCIIVLFAGR